MIKRTIVVMMVVVLCAVVAQTSRLLASDSLPLAWGDPEIARDIMSGTANVLIIGDSLQSNQRPANMMYWTPDDFGGLTLATDMSGSTVGGVFSPWFYPAWVSSMTLRAPNDPAGPDGLTGVSPGVSIHWVFDDVQVPSDNGSILNNRFLSAYLSPYAANLHFGDAWTPQSNGDITVDSIIYTSPSGLPSGIVLEIWQGTNYYAPPLASIPVNAYSATPEIQKLSLVFAADQWDPQQELRVQFRMVPGTIPTEGSTFAALGTRFHASTGLSFTTVARGGKGVSYFLDQYNCTDDNLAGFLNATETNIAYIWLGANDPIDGWKESMEQLLDRYKAAKPDLRFLLISTYDLGKSKYPMMAEYLYEITSQRDDALFLNLFEVAGSYDFFLANNYLGDGVHQNAAGAAYLADLLWDLITDAGRQRDHGDFDFDGDVDADDIDLFCANFGNPMYDLDGDGDADQLDMDILVH